MQGNEPGASGVRRIFGRFVDRLDVSEDDGGTIRGGQGDRVRKLFGGLLVLAVVTSIGLAPPARAVVPPPNDNFASAQALVGNTGTTTGTNLNATAEPGEPAHANGPTGPFASVWYSWTAPGDGSVTFDTCGSGYDSTMAAYTGSAVNALTSKAANDDNGATGCDQESKISFNVTATTYHVAVDGFNGLQGNITLNWAYLPAPTNDDFANAETITGASGALKETTDGATGEVDEPDWTDSGDGPFNSVWYSWTAPSDAPAQFNVCAPDFDAFVVVATGTGLSDLAFVAGSLGSCVDGGGAVFSAESGTQYFVTVDGASSSGPFKLTWQRPTYLPDGKIKKSSDASFVGDNAYQSFDNEYDLITKAGKTLTFDLQFENDGTAADSFTIFGFCDGKKPVPVRFFDGSTDVTDDVLFFGLNTPSLDPGEHQALTMRVKAPKKPKQFVDCYVEADSRTVEGPYDFAEAFIVTK